MRIAAGILASVLALWLAFRFVDAAELGRIVQSAKPGWILLALLFYWIELLVRVQRWALILRPVRRLPFRQVADALIVGYAANNVMPARLGEVFRASFASRRYGVPGFSAASTIAIERLLDLVAVTLCAATGGAFLLHGSSSLKAVILTGTATALALVVAALVLVYALHLPLADRLIRRFPSLVSPVAALKEGFKSLRRPQLLGGVVGLSVVTWFWNGLAIASILRALGVVPDITAILLLLGVSGVAAAVPSAPAGIGVLQFAFVTALAALGHTGAIGFAAALLVQFFLLGSVTLVGSLLYAGSQLPPSRGRTTG